jgi:hypothetical protein
MQYVRQAGSDPAFLLKAMGEASGELRRLFRGLRRRDFFEPGDPPDEDWCLMAIAFHVGQAEKQVREQLTAMVRRRDPEIAHADLDDIPFRADYVDCDEEDLLDEFHGYRRRNAYLLWDLEPQGWQRAGIHPYRGRIEIVDIARELYQHDLEHLWQARRIVDSLVERRR